NGVAVRVAKRYGFPESHLAVQLDGARGHDAQEPGLPVDQVVGLLLRRVRTPVARRQVFEELDARPRRGAQRGDAQAGAEYVVETLLLRSVVLARAGNFHAQAVAIEPQTRLCV